LPALSDRTRGVLLCLLAGVLWSTQGLMLRAIEPVDPWQVNVWRSGLTGCLILVGLVVRYRGGVLRAIQSIGRPGVLGAICFATSNTCFILALTLTTVANTLFMISSEPILAALLAWLVLREPVRAATWGAIIGAGTGIAIMVGGADPNGIAGSLLALLGSFAFASLAVILRASRTTDMVPVVVVGSGIVAASSTLVLAGDVWIGSLGFLSCAAMAVTSSVGFIAFFRGARELPAAQVMVLAAIEVVLGPLWVLLVFNEVPTLWTFVGGAIIVVAVLVQALFAGGARHAP
jgi:drug/metabolite transporter (DMT)-like permease